MSQGICTSCLQYRWLGGKGKVCKPCGYPSGPCAQCAKIRKLYVDDLCYCCYADRQVRDKLEILEKSATIPWQYNLYLWTLYLTYIRRYLLTYHHLNQAKKLVKILQKELLSPPLLAWSQIYDYAKTYPLSHYQASTKGCGWLKIGRMLQELGILPPRPEEFKHRIIKKMLEFPPPLKGKVQEFLEQLKKSNRSDSTQLEYLLTLQTLKRWADSLDCDLGLLTIQAPHLQSYLGYLKHLHPNPHFIRQHCHLLKGFYRYCSNQKWILTNPTDFFRISRPAQQLPICSEEDLKQLFIFVKNSKSPPEAALLICLILFFGLTTEDLAFATLDPSKESLSIILRRKQRTKGRRYYNRLQRLQLPAQPEWFNQLQHRFYQTWITQSRQTKKTYPHFSLIFSLHLNHNRPVNKFTVRKRLGIATTAATGHDIPLRILRQTCGHLHSLHGEASLLTRLGWSPQFAFHYTWLPRILFTAKK